MMEVETKWLCLMLNITVMISTTFAGKGIVRCDCTTDECISAGKTMCVAKKTCYTELYENKLTRGCDPNGLACENRPPSGLGVEWPTLHCCKDRDLCNKHVIPNMADKTPEVQEIPFLEESLPIPSDDDDDDNNNDNNNNINSEHELCPHNSVSSSSSSSNSDPSSVPQPKTKIINPIYIAVPVAGVCVLLALIIFAMYLLRRRTVYHHNHHGHHHHHGHNHHENFHHYHQQHDHVPDLSNHNNKQNGVPQLHHPHLINHHQQQPHQHHCQCVCSSKKPPSLPACSKSNRCTESERSSSGSETKLFLQT